MSSSRTFLSRSFRASPPAPASLLRTSPSSESAKVAMRLCAGRPYEMTEVESVTSTPPAISAILALSAARQRSGDRRRGAGRAGRRR